MENTVYILTVVYSRKDGSETHEVLGAYSNIALAQKMMNNLGDKDIAYRKRDWSVNEDALVIDKGYSSYNIYLKALPNLYHEYLNIYSRQIDVNVGY